MYVYVCYLLNAPNSRGNKTVNQHNPCVTMTVMTKGVYKCRDECIVIGCFFHSQWWGDDNIYEYCTTIEYWLLSIGTSILSEHKIILKLNKSFDSWSIWFLSISSCVPLFDCKHNIVIVIRRLFMSSKYFCTL